MLFWLQRFTKVIALYIKEEYTGTILITTKVLNIGTDVSGQIVYLQIRLFLSMSRLIRVFSVVSFHLYLLPVDTFIVVKK